MTESTTSAGQLKFKAPASDEWCARRRNTWAELLSNEQKMQS